MKRSRLFPPCPRRDIFYVKYHKEDGTKGVVLLEACEKTLKAFKYYGGNTTVMRKTRH